MMMPRAPRFVLRPFRAFALVAAAMLALAHGGAGCVAVPDLRFVGDAGTDAPSTKDGSPQDDASGFDGGGTCSDPAPSGGTCCGSVWCLDQCNPSNCDQCARAGCAAGDVCCGKTGTVQCKPKCP